MKILDQPDAPGYYWWRERPEYKWHLARVRPSYALPKELAVDFFDNRLYAVNLDGNFYGHWVKAEINEPTETGAAF